MESFSITQTDSGVHIESFPDAVKVIKLGGPEAKRLADLALHKSDLDFASGCLDAINSTEQIVIRQALWQSAIIHFMKCFGKNRGRPAKLDPKKVLRGDLEGQEVLGYFRSLRNKHIVHDENSYSQAIPRAILNEEGQAYKIEKVICLSATGETLGQDNFSNLDLLINRTREWVVSEFDKLCNNLTSKLEMMSYADLQEKPDVVYSLPRLDEISQVRSIT